MIRLKLLPPLTRIVGTREILVALDRGPLRLVLERAVAENDRFREAMLDPTGRLSPEYACLVNGAPCNASDLDEVDVSERDDITVLLPVAGGSGATALAADPEAEAYRRAGWWAGVTVPEVLEHQAGRVPGKTALIAGDRRLTYGELLADVRRAALAFAGLGLGPGDRVVLQLPNLVEFVLCHLGLQRIGAVPVLCQPRYAFREIDHLVRLSGAVAWITHPPTHADGWGLLLTQMRDAHPDVGVVTVGGAGPRHLEALLASVESIDEERLARYPRDPRALCHLMPTGGTTGLPKLVPRTHDDFLCNCRFRAAAALRGPDDVFLIATPVTHNMAMEVSLLPGLWLGATVVLSASTAAGDILEAIARERVTFTILVPTQLHDLMSHPDLVRVDLSSLRALAGAGDRIPPELITEIRERTGRSFIHVYGMSEGPCANTRPDDPLELVRTTVGFPICPGDEFRVVDDAGKPVPPGESGELVARGPGVFKGYLNAEEINRDAFLPGGFFRTGDLARIDPEGRITLTGRRKDVIVRGGVKISVALIEQYLGSLPEIRRAAVVGIPDARLGERICAFVELAAGGAPTPESIARVFRREGIAVMFCPERVEVVDTFPLTGVGKLDRSRLKEMAKRLLIEPEPSHRGG